MTRYRALARLTALVAMLAATLGVVTLTPMAASAAPKGPYSPPGAYPPPPPSVVVNKGTVKIKVTVKATGRQFRAKERVNIRVTFTPKGSHRSRVVRRDVVRTDSKGRFVYTVRTFAAGTLTIAAIGRRSGKAGSASVYVLAKTKGKAIKAHAFESASSGTTGGNLVLVAGGRNDGSDTPGVALAGLGAMALAGSAVVTRRSVRRRSQARAAA